jgi:hypothetical protein
MNLLGLPSTPLRRQTTPHPYTHPSTCAISEIPPRHAAKTHHLWHGRNHATPAHVASSQHLLKKWCSKRLTDAARPSSDPGDQDLGFSRSSLSEETRDAATMPLARQWRNDPPAAILNRSLLSFYQQSCLSNLHPARSPLTTRVIVTTIFRGRRPNFYGPFQDHDWWHPIHRLSLSGKESLGGGGRRVGIMP